MHPHLSGDVGENLVAVFELYTEHRVGERLDDRSLNEDRVVLGLSYGAPPGAGARARHAEIRRGDPEGYIRRAPEGNLGPENLPGTDGRTTSAGAADRRRRQPDETPRMPPRARAAKPTQPGRDQVRASPPPSEPAAGAGDRGRRRRRRCGSAGRGRGGAHRTARPPAAPGRLRGTRCRSPSAPQTRSSEIAGPPATGWRFPRISTPSRLSSWIRPGRPVPAGGRASPVPGVVENVVARCGAGARPRRRPRRPRPPSTSLPSSQTSFTPGPPPPAASRKLR